MVLCWFWVGGFGWWFDDLGFVILFVLWLCCGLVVGLGRFGMDLCA